MGILTGMAKRSARSPGTTFKPGPDVRRYHGGRKPGAVSAKSREEFELWRDQVRHQVRIRVFETFSKHVDEITDVVIAEARKGDYKFGS